MSNAIEYGEPWRNELFAGMPIIVDSSGTIVFEAQDDFGEPAMPDALQHRIVACVNACAGIPTNQLLAQLRWRKEPPITPGWYLTYTPSNDNAFGFDVVQIYQSGGGLFAPLLAATADGRAYEFLPRCKLPGKRLWAGPIKRPEIDTHEAAH